MHINVNGGHSPSAPGASGLLDEVACDREVKDALIAELALRGYDTSDSTSEASTAPRVLAEQARAANASGADLAVSIHLNAGGGTGVEVWYWDGSQEGYEYAQRTSAALASAMGLPDRGAKATRNLYWLNSTSMTSVLVEVCFVDRQEDYDAYNALGADGIARAIADGLVGEAPSAKRSSGWQESDGRWWWKWDDGTYPQDEWQQLDGAWYRFDAEGYMQTGWQEVDGSWYYLNPADDGTLGVMLTGWQLIDGWWYYLDDDGVMQTGWLELGGSAYWLDEDGHMVTGWCKPQGSWAYFDESGAMARNECRCIDGKWYAFAPDGTLHEDAIETAIGGALVL